MVFHAMENSRGAFIGQVLPRNGTNATRNVRFLIANQRDVPDIAITEDGDLYTLRGLDRETRQNYSITVIAETTRGLGIFQVSSQINIFLNFLLSLCRIIVFSLGLIAKHKYSKDLNFENLIYQNI